MLRTFGYTVNFSYPSTARRKAKFKIQNSKSLYNGLFMDFEWSIYLRRLVLAIHCCSLFASRSQQRAGDIWLMRL